MGKAKGKKKGTPSYMAPELFDVNGVYSFQSDLWALGCIMY
jgi:serine/threonine-protein kinase ULK4